MTAENTIETYISGAELHGVGTNGGDSEKTNLGYSILNEAYQLLKKDNLLSRLKPLIEHNNVSVRLWSSSHLLHINSEVALPVLEAISKGSGLSAFDAKMTIKKWKEGTLSF